MILRAERHAAARVGLQVGEVDQILGLGKASRQIVLGLALGAAAPIQRLAGWLHFDALEFTGVVLVAHS